MKCKCGCGQDAPVAKRTSTEKGWVRGKPLRFVHGHNQRRYHGTPATAKCRTCDRDLPASDYYVDKARPNGLSSQCRDCRKAQAAAQYAKDKARAQKLAKAWRAANPDRFRESQRKWDRTHPRERAEVQSRRRVRLKSGIVEKIDPWFIYARDGGRCHICGKHVPKTKMSLDHLIPVSKGGNHAATNVKLAHLLCNVKRGPGRTDAQLLLV